MNSNRLETEKNNEFNMNLQLFSGHGGFSGIGKGGGAEFKKESREIAKEMTRDYNILDKRKSQNEIRQFFEGAAQVKDGIVVKDDGDLKVKAFIQKKAEELAQKLADKIRFRDAEAADAYEDLKSRIGDRKYYIDPSSRAEIDEFRRFQKNSPVELTTRHETFDKKTGKWYHPTEVDKLYQDLYNDGANRFGISGNAVNGAEAVREINKALRDLRSQRTFDIYSDKARVETQTRSVQEFVRGLRDDLIQNAGITQILWDSTPGGRRGRRKKK